MDWQCRCGARNDGANCEICGEPRARATTTLLDAPPKTNRTCGHCGKSRTSEVVGDKASLPCGNCGAISSWFCETCGSRAPGTITENGTQRCSSCRFKELPAPNEHDRAAAAVSIARFRETMTKIAIEKAVTL